MNSTYAPAGNVYNYPFQSTKLKTISRLCISMLFYDNTLRSFATCVSRGLMTVVARDRQNNPMVGILFSKEIIYRENGSTVFNIIHGGPQIFVVQWSKKLSHSKHLLVS